MPSNLRFDVKTLFSPAGIFKVAQTICHMLVTLGLIILLRFGKKDLPFLGNWSTKTVVGAICMGMMLYNTTVGGMVRYIPHTFFFNLVVIAFLFSTFLLLIAYLFEGEDLKKSVFEIFHHLLASVLYFCASVTLSVAFAKLDESDDGYGTTMLAMALGFVNTILYLVCTLEAVRHFRN